jgi:hypothetical protein
MAILSPSPKLQFFDANGNPLVGGQLYTYAAGTTTPLASYTDSSGSTANTNPIILDSRGEANVWLASGTAYKFVLQTATGTTIWTVDNIDATLGTMASQNANAVAITGGTISVSTIAASGAVTLSGGTANGVAYLNGSKVLTSGSALVFDGSSLGVGVTPPATASTNYKGYWLTNACSMTAYNAGPQPALYLQTNGFFNGTNVVYSVTGYRYTNFAADNGSFTWSIAPVGTAGNTVTATQAMTLNASGQLNLNSVGSASGDAVLDITQSGFGQTAVFYQCGSGSPNAATAALKTWTATSGRSINASGTINASGADYAEYMTKAGDFTVAKGAVVGINAEGKLTNVFADAISFAVKSTDPSYVGGDVWGTETALGMEQPKQPVQRQATEDAETDEEFAVRQAQYESDKAAFNVVLETARQTVDRIAFAGQVPVNVTGATAGQYIIPVNDNGAIKGVAVSSPTFEQYQQAVGKVIAIEQDGRARIIVKVA